MVDETNPRLTDRELLVRIDAKLDGVIEDKKDHEARLRLIEERVGHFVTGKQLWAGLASAVAVAGSAFPIFHWLTSR